MRLKYLTIFFMGHVIMMLGCKSNVDKLETTDLDVYERLEVEFKKNAEIIPGYTFDSIVNTDSLLKFYVTDSLDHFNNVLASQKITYSIRTLLKTTINLPSTSELYVNTVSYTHLTLPTSDLV